MRASFVDLHCDTLLTLRQEQCGLENAPGHINLKKLQQGGALLQCLAIFVPDHEDAVKYGITESPWEFFNSQYALCCREMEGVGFMAVRNTMGIPELMPPRIPP